MFSFFFAPSGGLSTAQVDCQQLAGDTCDVTGLAESMVDVGLSQTEVVPAERVFFLMRFIRVIWWPCLRILGHFWPWTMIDL